MVRRTVKANLIIIFLLLMMQFAGCIPTSPIPSWVKQKPGGDANTLYEVGICARTFKRKDAIDRAFDDAIAKLSKRIRVEVKSRYIETIGEGGGIERETKLKISSEAVDLALYGAEQIDSWYDKKGLVGERATTYVLVRWSEGKFRQRVEKLLKDLKERQEIPR